MGEPGCALEENIYVAGGGYSQTGWKLYSVYASSAYNNPERINNEGGGITGYMYLKYNDLELEKLMLHGRISACIVMRKHC